MLGNVELLQTLVQWWRCYGLHLVCSHSAVCSTHFQWKEDVYEAFHYLKPALSIARALMISHVNRLLWTFCNLQQWPLVHNTCCNPRIGIIEESSPIVLAHYYVVVFYWFWNSFTAFPPSVGSEHANTQCATTHTHSSIGQESNSAREQLGGSLPCSRASFIGVEFWTFMQFSKWWQNITHVKIHSFFLVPTYL